MAKKDERTRGELKARIEILDVEIEETKNEEARNKLMAEREGIMARLADSGDKALKRAREELAVAQAVAAVTDKQSDLNAARIKQKEAELQLRREELATEVKKLAAGEQNAEQVAKLIGDIETLQKDHEKLTDKSEEYTDQIRNAGNFAKGLGASIGLASKYQETFLGKMESTLNGLMGNVEAQKEFVKQLKETFSVKNAIASVSSKIFQSTMLAAKAYDDATTSFNAATGAAGEYNSAIEAAGRGSTAFGVTTAEAGKAMGALHANMSNFTNLSKSTVTSLAQSTAALENLGISSETTAKTVDTLGHHLGMSATDAMAHAKQMATFGAGIGVAPAKMAEDFAAATPLIVQYGKEGVKVFKNLAKTSKSTGIEMQTLLGIVKQFDTFEGAAQAAGKLNALLGGPYLNSVELLTATEDERVDMLRESIAMSGKSWEAMNKYEQQSIMAAAGISDLDTAGRLFGANSAEVTEKQKKLNEMIQSSIGVLDKLKTVAMNFAIMIGPLVGWISDLASAINEMMDASEGWSIFFKGMAITIGILLLAYKGWAFWLKISTMWKIKSALASSAEAAGNIEVGSTAPLAAGGTKLMGEAARFSAPQMLALGAAVLMMGAAIFVAAAGVALLVYSFSFLEGEQILGAVAALAIFGVTIVILASTLAGLVASGVLPLAAAALFTLGQALLMIGGAVLVAGIGFMVMVMAFDKFVGILEKPGIKELGSVAVDIFGISFAMAALALISLSFPVIALALGAMALGVVALAAAVALIKTEDLKILADLGKAMSEMTGEKSLAFKASMTGMKEVIDAAKSAGVEVMVGTTQFVEAVASAAPAPVPPMSPTRANMTSATGRAVNSVTPTTRCANAC